MRKFVHVAVVGSLLTAASADAQAPAAPATPAPEAPPAGSPAAAAPVILAPVEVAPAPVTVQTAPPAAPAASEPPEAKSTAAVAVSEPAPAAEEEESAWNDVITIGGYVEAYYSRNFANPENNITANRWLDEKHNNFTLATAVLDVSAKKGPVSGRVTLMFGPTADRWYFEGAQIPSSETNAYLNFGAYSNETWKNIQSAYVAYEAPIGNGLTITGGLMPTQVGYEGAAVKDNWNWSRSNLFNFLPFFHLGVRATYPVTESWSLTTAAYNGWNQPTDLNGGKAFSLQSAYVGDSVLFNLLYLGGNERPEGDPAGKPWRNLFDAVVQYDVLPMLSLAANLDAGFEKGDLGTNSWLAAAVYARAQATEWLYFAARGDGIYQKAKDADVNAPIALAGSDFVASGTFTVEVRPVDGISFRLEYRHDASDDEKPMFYKSGYNADGTQRLSASQNTLTIGMTGWF